MILSALQFLIAILFSIVAAYVAGLSEGDIPIIAFLIPALWLLPKSGFSSVVMLLAMGIFGLTLPLQPVALSISQWVLIPLLMVAFSPRSNWGSDLSQCFDCTHFASRHHGNAIGGQTGRLTYGDCGADSYGDVDLVGSSRLETKSCSQLVGIGFSDSALGGRAILCGHPSVTDNRNYCCMRKPDPQSNPFFKLGKLVGMEPTLCQFCCVSRFTRDRSAQSGLCGMDLHFGHSLDHRLCIEKHRGSARIVH